MRRTLGTTLLGLVLLTGGCGSDEHVSATGDPPPVRATVVHATAAGGHVTDRATVLGDAAAIGTYVARLRGALPGRIRRAARRLDIPDGQVLVAAVVAVGCDVPPSVSVSGSGADAVFTAQRVASPMAECLAPVTTVALAVVPD